MNNKFNEQRYSIKMPVDGIDKTRINFFLGNIPDNKLKILDIGCWDGSYAVRFKKRTNIVYGVESSRTAATKAKQKRIIVQQGNYMEERFFTNIKFDIVVAGEIIEHVFDTDLFLEKIKKNLKKNGILLLSTPNVASLPRRLLLLLGINPILEFRNIPKITAGHIRYFTFRDLHGLLTEHNFEIISSRSDVLNFNNAGTLYSTLVPRIYKYFGKTIMIAAKNK